jgi:hypothetical protein
MNGSRAGLWPQRVPTQNLFGLELAPLLGANQITGINSKGSGDSGLIDLPTLVFAQVICLLVTF